MSNFHCIPESCARVVWREYLPPVVRWRYEGEDWQEVEADDYSVEQQVGQCPTQYKIEGTYANANTKIGKKCGERLLFRGTFRGKFIRFKFFHHSGFNHLMGGYEYEDYDGNIQTNLALGQSGELFAYDSCREVNRAERFAIATEQLILTNIYRTDGEPDDCGGCEFTITKNGAVVHTETRDDCPEVEKLPCRLSDESKEIEIEKREYLERIEVRNQDINLIYVSPLEAPLIDSSPLPPNCLNIYQTFVTAPPFLSNYVPLPGAFNLYSYVEQICSAPGCPAPEYTVICDCNSCESCPSRTCAVECDGHICCYDTETGISVKQINLNDYCEGET